jgi:transcriptional regulator with XRE-family HTH domain
LSLEELAAALGGLVSRQALWKYEHGKAQPSATTASKIASALGVKTVDLVIEPATRVRLIAYRKRPNLTKTEQERIESLVSLSLEERVRIQERLGLMHGGDQIPAQTVICSLKEAEAAADALRKRWELGRDAISNVVAVLEDRGIHVLEIDADSKFDGISAVAFDAHGKAVGAAVVT